jgi:hypothetical protein
LLEVSNVAADVYPDRTAAALKAKELRVGDHH